MTATGASEADHFALVAAPVFLLDAGGRVKAWNPAMEAATGVAAADVVGKRAWTALASKRFQTPADAAISSAAEEVEDNFVVTHRATGEKKTYRIVARPLLTGPEEVQGVVATLLEKGDLGGAQGLAEIVEVLRSVDTNDYTSRVTGQYEGMLGQAASAINQILVRLCRIIDVCEKISRGDLSDLDAYRSIGNGKGRRSDRDKITPAIIRMHESILEFVAETEKMSEKQLQGDYEARMPPDRFEGVFRTMATGVNDVLAIESDAVLKILGCIDEFSKGNFDAPLAMLPGKKRLANEIVEQVRGRLKAVIADVDMLVHAAVEGQLSTRADASKHAGDFRKIVDGINKTLDAVIAPIDEATNVLAQVAQQDLTVRVQGEYQGDLAKLKDSINRSAGSLEEAFTRVSDAVEQVATASSQIASSSQSVAQGASEQASSLEEVSSSLEEISAMTKQNADNTRHAKGLAQQTTLSANKGSEAMAKMVDAMGKIRASAEGTAQIIRDINEIAFQTNLLALNAAVEAARAGDAGRGFAVVAEEVRNLALRSKDAAKKTEDLIKQSVSLADNGQLISKEVNGNLSEIVESVGKVSGIIGEITEASQEQARGIDHVSNAMSEMDKVTQQNAANSEESSSTAQELSSQALELSTLIGAFQISGATAATTGPLGKAGLKTAETLPRLGNGKTASKNNAKTRANGFARPLRPEEMIPLEDDQELKDF